MKKFLSIVFLLVSFVATAQQLDNIIKTPPSPLRLVSDYANALTPEQEHTLEEKLVAYDDSTSSQIAIVLVKKLEGNNLEDAALSILRNWGVGTKKHDNGIVILVAVEDRKITIQTGYGLEKAITDLIAKAIIDNDISPNFKKGNYYQGLNLATDDIIRAAAGSYQAPEGYGKKSGKGIGLGIIIFIIILLVVFGGAGGGRGGGGMVSRRGYGDIGTGWLLGSLLGGGGGGSSGGGWSGGGGGGGFGGFGGGSGGGGGASGSW